MQWVLLSDFCTVANRQIIMKIRSVTFWEGVDGLHSRPKLLYMNKKLLYRRNVVPVTSLVITPFKVTNR